MSLCIYLLDLSFYLLKLHVDVVKQSNFLLSHRIMFKDMLLNISCHLFLLEELGKLPMVDLLLALALLGLFFCATAFSSQFLGILLLFINDLFLYWLKDLFKCLQHQLLFKSKLLGEEWRELLYVHGLAFF